MDISFDEFEEFLRRNNCESQFERAFYLQNGGNRIDPRLWEILEPDECFFNVALDWSRTPEGREYWKRIDELWYREHCE